MIDYEALFKISYGLYIVCSGNKKKGNGFISNTVFQVTAEPPRFAACCNKNNYTAIATLEFKVAQKIDVRTHNLYIGELIDARMLNETNEPMTYAYYRQVRKGYAALNAPTFIDKSKLVKNTEPVKSIVYKCSACGYIYDENREGHKLSDLPENWKCPVCGSEKEFFNEV